MKDLTKKQMSVYLAIKSWVKRQGWAPTIRELAEEFGVSHATMFGHLNALDRKGYIHRGQGARQIEVCK